jgi:hypothetical protein
VPSTRVSAMPMMLTRDAGFISISAVVNTCGGVCGSGWGGSCVCETVSLEIYFKKGDNAVDGLPPQWNDV